MLLSFFTFEAALWKFNTLISTKGVGIIYASLRARVLMSSAVNQTQVYGFTADTSKHEASPLTKLQHADSGCCFIFFFSLKALLIKQNLSETHSTPGSWLAQS